jgi:hypothetical protein
VTKWLSLQSMAIDLLQGKPPIHPSIVTFCSNCTSSRRCVAGRFWSLPPCHYWKGGKASDPASTRLLAKVRRLGEATSMIGYVPTQLYRAYWRP